MFVGIASYARSRAFKACLQSLARARIVRGAVAAIDALDPRHRDQYLQAIKKTKSLGIEVIADVSSKRRGSANARNTVLNLASSC